MIKNTLHIGKILGLVALVLYYFSFYEICILLLIVGVIFAWRSGPTLAYLLGIAIVSISLIPLVGITLRFLGIMVLIGTVLDIILLRQSKEDSHTFLIIHRCP